MLLGLVFQENNRLKAGVMHSRVQRAFEQLAHIASHPKLRRDFELLTSIDGVGRQAAAKFLGEQNAAENFGTARQLEVFCGVAPRLYESGSSIRSRAKMSKVGSSRVRSALFMPAVSAMRVNPARLLAAWQTDRGSCDAQNSSLHVRCNEIRKTI